MQEREDALQAGAGVDARPGQGLEGTVGGAVVLHEDQIPDLDEPFLPSVGRSPLVPVVGTLVKEDLRARTARPGIAHLPEVVLAQPLDPGGGDAHGVDPDLLGVIVGLVHGDPQALPVQSEDTGHQLPGEGDGFGLEVVAEAEVAQHLEEGAVAVGGAHDVDVHRAEAFLHRGGPRPGRRLVAQEEGLEGDHPGDGEQHGGVVGNEAGRRDGRCGPFR